ncbi:MAG: RNA-binding S4 domain-containing protein [Wenzhouxiangella sp.]
MSDSVRLDKWLWAARFFKTRSMSQTAIKGGHVDINGQRAKPSRLVRTGDKLRITRGEYAYEIEVLDLSERRLSAPLARELYAESEASQKAREEKIEQNRLLRSQNETAPQGRPDKRQRRQIKRLREQ